MSKRLSLHFLRRLFVSVISENITASKVSTASLEKSILDNAFSLIFAFDELVSFGYREDLNVSQLKTIVSMESQDEKVFKALRRNQEREAKQIMKRRAKEIAQLQRQQANSQRGFSSRSGDTVLSTSTSSDVSSGKTDPIVVGKGKEDPSYINGNSKASSARKVPRGMKLGLKSKTSSFLLEEESVGPGLIAVSADGDNKCNMESNSTEQQMAR